MALSHAPKDTGVMSSRGLQCAFLISLRKAPQEHTIVHSPIFSDLRIQIESSSSLKLMNGVFFVVWQLSFLTSIIHPLPRKQQECSRKTYRCRLMSASAPLRQQIPSHWSQEGSRSCSGFELSSGCHFSELCSRLCRWGRYFTLHHPMNICMSDTHLPCLGNNYSKKSWKNVTEKKPWPVWQSQLN